MADLRERILAAHGGESRWRAITRIDARISMGGTMFVTHMQPRPLDAAEMALDLRRFRVMLHPFGSAGRVGMFEPRRVWIEESDGRLIGERGAPGVVARSLRHRIIWDSLDVLFVLGVSVWQALLLPQMLCRSGCTVKPTVSGVAGASMDVHLPADVPVPAVRQRLYASATGQLIRADYAPMAWGQTLRIGQLLNAPEAVDGLLFATRQSVHPLWPGGQIASGVRLAWLTVDDLALAA